MHTHRILVASALSAALFAGTGCANDGQPSLADDTAPVTAPDVTADDVPGALPDEATAQAAETLALVMAVDEHEIAAAEQARGKELPDDVRAYADMLHAEHGTNLLRDRIVAGAAGLATAQTAAVQDQKRQGADERDRLAALDGPAYAEAYVNAMVQGHEDALALLDARMGTATDATLRDHLAATRDAIARHLEHGRKLQGGNDTGEATTD